MLATFNAILVEEANLLDGDLFERSIHTSPWVDLVDTGAFPEGMGDIISTMIWERSFPTGAIEWKNLMGADAGNDAILPATRQISTAKTLREYRLQHTALESDELNLNDLRTAAIREEQLGAMRNNLSMNTNYLWQTRARQEYDRLTSHVSIVAAGNTESAAGGTADSTLTDSLISNPILAKYRQRMIRMQARPYDRVDGAPIFALVTDSEVSDSIKSETAITEAMKFSGRASELLSPLGVDRAYKNFFHICDDIAPRYTWVATQTVKSVTMTNPGAGYTATPVITFTGGGGTGAAGYAIMNNDKVSSIVITSNGTGYTSAPTVVFTGGSPTTSGAGTAVVGGSYAEVAPYTAATPDAANGKFGARLVENSAYEDAAYTRSYIYHPEVMKMLYPNSISGSNGTQFDPVQYRGEWKWLNVLNLDPNSVAYNPDGTKGRFRGVFAAATKPGVTEFGFSFTHKRPGF